MALDQSHKLEDEAHKALYKKYEAQYLPKSKARENPVAIITGGQPGSGKSGLTKKKQNYD